MQRKYDTVLLRMAHFLLTVSLVVCLLACLLACLRVYFLVCWINDKISVSHFIQSCVRYAKITKTVDDEIIIIWHYNPLWVFAFSAKSLRVLLSLAASFQFLTFSFFKSSMTSSCHRCLGFPTGLVPIGFKSKSFLVGLAWSILWICPSHLILCTLINLTISAPSIKLSSI